MEQFPHFQFRTIQGTQFFHHHQRFQRIGNGIEIPILQNHFLHPAVNRLLLTRQPHLKYLRQKYRRLPGAHILP